MFIINNSKIFLSISALLVLLSIIFIFVFGLNFGVDFKGGTIIETTYEDVRPNIEALKSELEATSISNFTLRPSGEKNIILSTSELTSEEVNTIQGILLKEKGEVVRVNTVGPTIGEELKSKSLMAIFIIVIAIIIFITIAFRKVSKPVSSWKYGLAAIIALVHDILIPTGVFVLLGKYYGVEIDLLFVTAMLAIFGYSVNDTIVVFDRIRENLKSNLDKNKKEEFSITVGNSISETLGRSLNTSLTLIFVLLVLFFLGGEATKYFILALLIGVTAGTYSSICLASPLLLIFKGKTE